MMNSPSFAQALTSGSAAWRSAGEPSASAGQQRGHATVRSNRVISIVFMSVSSLIGLRRPLVAGLSASSCCVARLNGPIPRGDERGIEARPPAR